MRHALLPLLLLTALPVLAQTAAPLDEAEKGRLLDRAKVLRDEASALRQAGDAAYETAQKACWQRFLVNSCLDEAKQAHRAEVSRARQLEQEAREIERDVRKREIADKEAQRLADAPRKEAEAAAEAERNRQAREEAMRRVAERQAEAARLGR
jgi:hypothetical protein